MSEAIPQKKSALWSLPVLRAFTPPSDAPVLTAEGAAFANETLPWSQPGSRLRAKSGKAARGQYAPALAGAPTTTRQAEILNTSLIGPPTGTQGIVIGQDQLSGTILSHDSITAYNLQPREVSSPNVIVLGTVGAGKSSHVKCNFVLRPMLLKGRRCVVFDKKDEGGEGEYSAVTRVLGYEPIKFAVDGTGTRLNILDPTIARGTGIRGQARLLSTVVRLARDDKELNQWEREALRAALIKTMSQAENGRTPVLTDVLPNLGEVASDPEYASLSPKARDQLHRAGLELRWTLNNLLEEYSGLLDGETSQNVDLKGKLTSFDISQLPDDGPAVPVVMAIGNMWMLGRLRDERNSATNVIYEEGWHMIGGPSAKLIKSNQKLSRGLGIANIFVMHNGTDIPKDSPGMSVIQEAQTVIIYRLSRPEDARWAQETFGLAPETSEVIQRLDNGNFIFKYGSHPETSARHIRSDWERGLTNTDTALAAGSRE